MLIPRKTKVGRNDPCPCGSEKKYKKCCLKFDEGDFSTEKPRVSGSPPEVIAKAVRKFREQDEALKDWTRRYGHIRPCISTDFHGHKMVAVGARLHYSK